MTISEIFRNAIKSLHRLSPTPLADAEYLLCHVLQKSRGFLFSHPDFALNGTQQAHFLRLLQKRSEGYPVAYLTESQGFFKYDFKVTEATLIPRPETELLIETALLKLDKNKPCRILDLGTGSGIIAISLALESHHWRVIAVDYSKNALEIAECNAKRLEAHNVTFVHSNWFENLPAQKFNLIISNPPYIADADPHLAAGDLRFEPYMALASGKNGLDAISGIIAMAPVYLNQYGYLMVEHGYQQHEEVHTLLKEQGFTHIQTNFDLNERPRVTLAQNKLFTNTET